MYLMYCNNLRGKYKIMQVDEGTTFIVYHNECVWLVPGTYVED